MDDPTARCAFLTRHGHVLIALARAPATPIRDLAAAARVSERTTQRILASLEQAGYLHRERIGRHTRYTLNPDPTSHHPAEAEPPAGALLELFTTCGTGQQAAPSGRFRPAVGESTDQVTA